MRNHWAMVVVLMAACGGSEMTPDDDDGSGPDAGLSNELQACTIDLGQGNTFDALCEPACVGWRSDSNNGRADCTGHNPVGTTDENGNYNTVGQCFGADVIEVDGRLGCCIGDTTDGFDPVPLRFFECE